MQLLSFRLYLRLQASKDKRPVVVLLNAIHNNYCLNKILTCVNLKGSKLQNSSLQR